MSILAPTAPKRIIRKPKAAVPAPKPLTESDIQRTLENNQDLYERLVQAVHDLNPAVNDAYIGSCEQQIAHYVAETRAPITAYMALLSELLG